MELYVVAIVFAHGDCVRLKNVLPVAQVQGECIGRPVDTEVRRLSSNGWTFAFNDRGARYFMRFGPKVPPGISRPF